MEGAIEGRARFDRGLWFFGRIGQVWYLPFDGEEPLASLDSLEGIRS